MLYNVSVVYNVFAVAIRERGAFQQPQKCAGVSRGRRRTLVRADLGERKPRAFRPEAYTILLCEVWAYTIIFYNFFIKPILLCSYHKTPQNTKFIHKITYQFTIRCFIEWMNIIVICL